MTLSLIVAYDRQRGIGKDNRMPWHLPADLAHFKRTTLGKPVIMGRKTFESIGKPLPGRRNLMISREVGKREGIECFASLESALQAVADAPEVMVIGGGQVYAAALPQATRIFATEVQAEFDVDTRFPALASAQWRAVAREHRAADERNAHAMDFVVYERIR